MQAQLDSIRERLLSSQKPLFFFDDDCDGLTSFLLLYRLVKKGKGIVVKSTPELDERYVARVEEFGPDLVVILDKPLVRQEFLDRVASFHVPVIWLDHHPVQEKQLVTYCNPRLVDASDGRPTSYWAWRIARQDVWIAMVGTVADWHLIPEVKELFCHDFPALLDSSVGTPEEALFHSPLGKLIKILQFNLKGKISEVNTSIKILTRIDDPFEIMEERSSRAKKIYRKFEIVEKLYAELLASIVVKDEPIIFFTYEDNKMSFTSEVSNELLFLHPEKVILIAREKSGELKCSIRSKDVIIPPLLAAALQGLEGYGGGHDHACGAAIKKKHFQEFFEKFSKLVAAARS